MSSICDDKRKCEDCKGRNYPDPCPCGFKDYPTWWAAEVPL